MVNTASARAYHGKGLLPGGGRREESRGYALRCLHNCWLRSLPFSPMFAWAVPPLALPRKVMSASPLAPSLSPQT